MITQQVFKGVVALAIPFITWWLLAIDLVIFRLLFVSVPFIAAAGSVYYILFNYILNDRQKEIIKNDEAVMIVNIRDGIKLDLNQCVVDVYTSNHLIIPIYRDMVFFKFININGSESIIISGLIFNKSARRKILRSGMIGKYIHRPMPVIRKDD